MLAFMGYITVALVLVAIMSKKISPLVALIVVPVTSALFSGQGLDTAEYMVQGIVRISPIAVMFIFAILYFGVMNDAGVFDPIIKKILNLVGKDPRKILPGTAILTACVHLDGSGATTFLIVVPPLLSLFDALKMDRRLLACVVAMSAGVNNILPWGGPTLRAAAALDLPVMEVYLPLLPVHLAGFAFVLAVAYWLGVREKKRLLSEQGLSLDHHSAESEHKPQSGGEPIRPGRFVLNIALTITIIALMISGVLQPVIAFLLGFVVALLINYPELDQQRKLIDAHSKPAVMMATLLFAAGVFTGILSGSGMLDAMAQSGASIIPESMSRQLPVLLAIAAMPLSFLFDPDSFYFGVMPVLGGVVSQAGVPAVQVAQAALMGQMTTGFPVSPLTPATFLLVGLSRVSLAEHQRFSIPFLFATSLVMTVIAVVLGVL